MAIPRSGSDRLSGVLARKTPRLNRRRQLSLIPNTLLFVRIALGLLFGPTGLQSFIHKRE